MHSARNSRQCFRSKTHPSNKKTGQTITSVRCTSSNQKRWKRGGNEQPFDLIRDQIIIETSDNTLLQVLRKGTVSTNIYLRRLHNFCLDVDWLLIPLLSRGGSGI
jgi:hypothetical protein